MSNWPLKCGRHVSHSMRSRMAACLAAIATVLLALPAADAAPPKIGDKPNIIMKTVDGRPVTSAILKGRIIVFDFWATWCHPCMGEVPHMIQLNQKYASQGVAIIGISLDEDLNGMQSTARQKGMTWPQICDGGGWNSPIAKGWGVNSIPRTFILSPEGEIIWTGHPGDIDEPLAAAIAKYPTQPVQQKKALDLLEQSLKVLTDEKDPAKALAALADLPNGVLPDAALKATATKLAAKLGKDALDGAPAAAKALIALGAPPPPAHALPTPTATATPVAANAPAIAEARLLAADKARAAGRDSDAYSDYKWILAHAAGTAAAETAQIRVAAYEADAPFMAGLKKAAAEKDAGSMLWLAQSLEHAGKTDSARENYQEIIKRYPDTQAAKDAAAALKAPK